MDLVDFDGWFHCRRKERQPRRLAGGLSTGSHDMGYCRILQSVTGDFKYRDKHTPGKRVSKAPINFLISN